MHHHRNGRGCGEPCPHTHVRHFGALDLELERGDEISVRVHLRLSTLLVAVARLAPDVPTWRFDVEAGGAQARGKLRLELAAPGFYSTLSGTFEYTASGDWNSYRGLLWHWEATGLPPGRPLWLDPPEALEIEEDVRVDEDVRVEERWP
ncbi:MAG: hypothetical protein M3389_08965 [Actinomycetota bacterium]|nr:hypothetical protein [Actinomycetota bacterium]